MSRAVVFKSVSGINCDMGVKPSPVRALEPHVAFYTGVLGFTLAGRDEQSAALKRDGVLLELVVTPGHAPAASGWCYCDVSDVEALHQEFLDGGATPEAIELQEYGGKRFRLFFLKEDYDNYCFCFGEPN
ncbi:MAG TPA: VOC family protein [Gemmataceae bacterium]|jgi:catechol 2,3-dioxygenase-like lactoylglutathione lyase family enzyme